MTTYTIKSDPPEPKRRSKRSYWPEVLEEVRAARGAWVRLAQPMTESTARQVASDLRNAHRRDPKKMRIRGTTSIDRWETVAGPNGDNPKEFFLWVRDASSDTAR